MSKQKPIDYKKDTKESSLNQTNSGSRRSVMDDIAADGLRKVREKCGLTRKELAEKIGISPQMMGRYEKKTEDKDPSKITLAIAYTVSSELGVKLEDFFDGVLDNTNQYALSDNQQKIIEDYSSNSETLTRDIDKLKSLYLSIQKPEKRQEFINLLENIIKTYQD